MKIKYYIPIVCFCLITQLVQANSANSTVETDTLPFYEIPEVPVMYNAATVTARMVDGLGFRYYWATKGLRPEDMAYEPGNDGQSCSSVLEHILGLSRFILRTVKNEVHDSSREYPELTWEEQRKETLNNLKEVSDMLRETGDVSGLPIIFKRGEQTSEMPFWNLLNGPIADAIYHTGQIVSYRRTTGNPTNPNVSVLRGKVKQ